MYVAVIINLCVSVHPGNCYDTDKTLIRVFKQPKHPGG